VDVLPRSKINITYFSSLEIASVIDIPEKPSVSKKLVCSTIFTSLEGQDRGVLTFLFQSLSDKGL